VRSSMQSWAFSSVRYRS